MHPYIVLIGLLVLSKSLTAHATTAANSLANTDSQPAGVAVLTGPPSHELNIVNYLKLKIAPSLGTQLYFPFVLNQVDSVVPFTVNITNSEVFLIKINQDRNFILISVPPGTASDEVGSLFIVVSDRHLNIRLGVGRKDEHTEAIYFTFSEQTQTQLIDQAVLEARAEMERKLADRVKEIKQQSAREAIAYVAELAQTRPTKINLRETLHGQHHRLYLSKVWEYQKFSIVFVEVSANTKGSDMRIDTIHLGAASGLVHAKYKAYLRCQPADNKNQQSCTAVFDRLGHWSDYDQIEVEIKSNLGLDHLVY